MYYKNVADQKVFFLAWDDIAETGKTGYAASLTPEISKDGGAFAAANDTTPTEVGDGVYYVVLTATESNADAVVLQVTPASSDISIEMIEITPVDVNTLTGYILNQSYSGYTTAGTIGYAVSLIASIVTILNAMAATVWSYANRSLTAVLPNGSENSPNGIAPTFKRGESIAVPVTVGDITGYTELWITVKTSYDDADSASIIQWTKTGGLIYLNAAAPSGGSGTGSITVVDASTGSLILNMDASESVNLVPAENLLIDCQKIVGGVVTTQAEGTAEITADITRAIS